VGGLPKTGEIPELVVITLVEDVDIWRLPRWDARYACRRIGRIGGRLEYERWTSSRRPPSRPAASTADPPAVHSEHRFGHRMSTGYPPTCPNRTPPGCSAIPTAPGIHTLCNPQACPHDVYEALPTHGASEGPPGAWRQATHCVDQGRCVVYLSHLVGESVWTGCGPPVDIMGISRVVHGTGWGYPVGDSGVPHPVDRMGTTLWGFGGRRTRPGEGGRPGREPVSWRTSCHPVGRGVDSCPGGDRLPLGVRNPHPP
jgi:hypothetical protein